MREVFRNGNFGAETTMPIVLLVSEGYTKNREGLFRQNCQKLAEGFGEKVGGNAELGIIGLWTPSNESTTSLTFGSPSVDSAFWAQYENRMLKVSDSRVRDAVGEWLASNPLRLAKDIVIGVIVDCQTRGGLGSYTRLFTTYNGSGIVDVGVHEWAHTACHLGDEYEAGKGNFPPHYSEPAYPNVSKNRSNWSDFTGFNGFEGAMGYETGVYRPEQMCAMRDEREGFCSVCERVIDGYLSLSEAPPTEPPATEPPPAPEPPATAEHASRIECVVSAEERPSTERTCKVYQDGKIWEGTLYRV